MNVKLVRLACLFIITANVKAETTSELDALTVTARPIGLQSIEHVAQPITVLSEQELKQKQSSTIGETLSNIPGVTTNRYSPLASRPIIRGLGGPRVKVLENGLSAMDVSTISVDHVVSIDPIQAEQIEIFRGPVTLLYGSEATGGLVNVVNNRIPQAIPTNFGSDYYASYNSNSNEGLLSMQLDGGLEKMAFQLDASHRDANDYDSADGRIRNSFYDSLNVNAGTSFVDDWGFVGISFGRFDSTHGIPFNPDEPDELPFIETEQDKISLSSRVDDPFEGISSLSLQLAYNDYTHTEFEGVAEPGTIFDNEQLEGRVELQHKSIGIFNGTIGSQFGYRNVNARGDEAFLPKTDRKYAAVFILEETDLNDDLHLEVGARLEHQQHDSVNVGEVTHNMYSLSSGLHWHFIESVAMGLNAGRSQRGPAAEELFSNGPHLATGTFEIGQNTLGEETVNSLDLSFYKEQGRWQWNVNLFVNYIEDFIFLQGQDTNVDGIADEVDEDGNLGGEFLLVRYEQDDAVFYGFEFETGLNLYSGSEGIIDTRLFADYVKGQLTNGDNLERISPARIGAGLDYTKDNLSAGIEWTQFLAQNDNGDLETDTGGYTLLNLSADYRVVNDGDRRLSVFARANNLLDEDGRLHTSFIKDRSPIMGTSVMVGFDAGF